MVLKNFKLLLKGLKDKEVTRVYPDIAPPVEKRWRGLHQLDPLLCIGCGSCVKVCPNNAISLVETKYPYKNPKNKKGYPEIDIGLCMFCGLCEEVCPVSAMKMGKDCELAAWTREELVYPPERLIPKGFEEAHSEQVEKIKQKLEEERIERAEKARKAREAKAEELPREGAETPEEKAVEPKKPRRGPPPGLTKEEIRQWAIEQAAKKKAAKKKEGKQ